MRSRLVAALLVGVAAAVFMYLTQSSMMASGDTPDSLVLWRGAKILLGGGNPYDAAVWTQIPIATADPSAWVERLEPLYYPLPALLIWAPFALGSFIVGSVAFGAFGAALFAFAVSRGGLHRLWLCGGVPFIVVLRFGQWSTWLVAAAAIPFLSFILVAKPNLGLPLLLARPTRAMILGCTAILVLSIAIAPGWPLAWWRNVSGSLGSSGAPHPAPIRAFGGAGIITLAALLRWRRPEARLVAFFSCVPQLPFWADQLPLNTVAVSQREVIWTVLTGHVAFLLWYAIAPKVAFYVPVMQPYAQAGTYLPALLIVLLRPNAGNVPKVVESLAAHLPAWLQGTTAVVPEAVSVEASSHHPK